MLLALAWSPLQLQVLLLGLHHLKCEDSKPHQLSVAHERVLATSLPLNQSLYWEKLARGPEGGVMWQGVKGDRFCACLRSACEWSVGASFIRSGAIRLHRAAPGSEQRIWIASAHFPQTGQGEAGLSLVPLSISISFDVLRARQASPVQSGPVWRTPEGSSSGPVRSKGRRKLSTLGFPPGPAGGLTWHPRSRSGSRLADVAALRGIEVFERPPPSAERPREPGSESFWEPFGIATFGKNSEPFFKQHLL